MRKLLVPDGRSVELQSSEPRSVIRLESESSKLSLRGASPILMERLIALLTERSQGDPDIRRLIEDAQRQDQPALRFGASSAAKASGISLEPLLTSYHASAGIDPWHAEKDLLLALPGVSAAAASTFVSGRDSVRGTADEDAFLASTLGPLAAEHFARQGYVFTCRAVGEYGVAPRSVVALARVIAIRGAETGDPVVEVLDEYRDSDWRQR